MAKIKVDELEGEALNAWVHNALMHTGRHEILTCGFPELIPYSTSWARGGPIIEREHIDIRWICLAETGFDGPWAWRADAMLPKVDESLRSVRFIHASPLVVAMRAFVASQFGYEVEA